MRWIYNVAWQMHDMIRPARLLLPLDLLEGEDVVQQHDDTAGLGQHGWLYGQVSLFLLLVRDWET